MRPYVLSREAERDLEELWDYIALDSPISADRFATKLFAAFELLASNPRIGHRHPGLTSYPVLFWSEIISSSIEPRSRGSKLSPSRTARATYPVSSADCVERISNSVSHQRPWLGQFTSVPQTLSKKSCLHSSAAAADRTRAPAFRA